MENDDKEIKVSINKISLELEWLLYYLFGFYINIK